MRINNNLNPENADFHISLKLIIKNKEGNILILKNPDRSLMKGYYELPGGRIKVGEQGQPLINVIKREIKEELGINFKYKVIEKPVATGQYHYQSKTYNKIQYLILIAFEAKYLSGDVTISDEHIGYLWAKLTKSNLKKYFTLGVLEMMKSYFIHRG